MGEREEGKKGRRKEGKSKKERKRERDWEGGKEGR